MQALLTLIWWPQEGEVVCTAIDIIDYVNGIGNSTCRLICTVQYGRALRVIPVVSVLRSL